MSIRHTFLATLTAALLGATACACTDRAQALPPSGIAADSVAASAAESDIRPTPHTTDYFRRTVDPADANPAGSTDIAAVRRALLEAFPDHIRAIDGNSITMADGSVVTLDDRRPKSFVEMLDDSDPEDMFFIAYSSDSLPPRPLHDAGRSRCEELFRKMYGATVAQVQSRLVPVGWRGGKVMFTSVNGAADSLRAVARELEQHPELRRYTASSGTFNWRPVRGAKRMSAHAYGIAIDIGVDHSDYWLWKNRGAGETDAISYANRFPHELVEIFERHGFVWGGAWYHYDTMHFEFRPELHAYTRHLPR